jgi:phosphoribosylaminoimidazole-succinocarboxamide synthase
MPESVRKYKDQLEGRVMLVKRCTILPVEAIVRGYITGSGMQEYKRKGTICDIPLASGLKEADKLPEPLFTPSTKAEIGEHDENIHPSKLVDIIGIEKSKQVQDWSIQIYSRARDYADAKGIIIADTKFEFGVDKNGQLTIVDEVLTPGN